MENPYPEVRTTENSEDLSCRYYTSEYRQRHEENDSNKARLSFRICGMYLSFSGTDEDCKKIYDAWSGLTLEDID